MSATPLPEEPDSDDLDLREDSSRRLAASLFSGAPLGPMPDALRAKGREAAQRFARERTALDLAPGAKVGPYEVRSLLGTGGQARVYLARHAETGREVALKVPRQKVAKRLARETEILIRLDHPRIVRIEEAKLQGDVPYLAMEHLRGGSLADLLVKERGRRLERARVEEIAWAVLEALEYAHARGVVHRDIKPGNILFDEHGDAKVADFGIGKVALLAQGAGGLPATLSRSATVFAGTPVYMAPEQEDPARGEGGRIDGRADLFSLGKVLYEALTGRSPRTIRPVTLDRGDVPPEWNDFLFHLVEERPQDRLASAGAAKEILAYLVRRGRDRDQEASPEPDLGAAGARSRLQLQREARAFERGYRAARADLSFAGGLGRPGPALALGLLGFLLVVLSRAGGPFAADLERLATRGGPALAAAGAGIVALAVSLAIARALMQDEGKTPLEAAEEGAEGQEESRGR